MLIQIPEITHPNYDAESDQWTKWRLTYKGGRDFVIEYLEKFSTLESDTDFLARRNVTYCPAFAKSAINDIKNSIFQRMVDVHRVGGHPTYREAILGQNGGINRCNQTMDSFIGLDVLPDLLTMSKVGVFVDMPELTGNTLLDTQGISPYLYLYKTEDIRSWAYDLPNYPDEFSSILLRDYLYDVDEDTKLPSGMYERYRHVYLADGGVKVDYHTSEGTLENTVFLQIPRIPFVVFELPTSLLEDVADYQIALLNIESSDINYIRKANFPFYVEQFDPRFEGGFFKPQANPDDEGDSASAEVGKDRTIKTGLNQGRRYPKGLDVPQFIHPSSEPLLASIKKGEQIKQDIRLLVNLSLTNMSPKMASAESKGMDLQSLESGLSHIGTVLQQGENKIAQYWAMYFKGSDAAQVTYPEDYSLKSDDERMQEAEDKEKLMGKLPSETFKREMAKSIANVLLSGKVTVNTLQTIRREIEEAPIMTSDTKVISEDLKNGLVSVETASKARGYKEGEVEQAKKDHAERIRRIKEAQGWADGQARGDADTQITQDDSSGEKVDKPKRGEGKLNE